MAEKMPPFRVSHDKSNDGQAAEKPVFASTKCDPPSGLAVRTQGIREANPVLFGIVLLLSVTILLLVGIFYLHQLLFPKANTTSESRAIQEKEAVPVPKTGSSQTVPFSGWTHSANGYTWKSASESEKRSLCNRLSSASRHGKSAETFYDALNVAYDSWDPNTLRVSIEFSAQWVEDY